MDAMILDEVDAALTHLSRPIRRELLDNNQEYAGDQAVKSVDEKAEKKQTDHE